jgi:hypothetical protein
VPVNRQAAGKPNVRGLDDARKMFADQATSARGNQRTTAVEMHIVCADRASGLVRAFAIAQVDVVFVQPLGFTNKVAKHQKVGWLMGLEPTTTGITILDSTN